MMGPISALIADDEFFIRSKLKMKLSTWFKIGEAETATSAMEKWPAFDVVLLDIKFPDGNGIDICRSIKDRDPHFTVIMSSSMEDVEAWNLAFKAGADGYLEKRELLSLAPEKIRLTIENLVERNNLRRQAEETAERQKELMTVLSHDVRAPFQAMLGAIESIRRFDLSHEVSKEVDTLHECASGQLAFINGLLEVLRLESGSVSLKKVDIDLNLPINLSVQNLLPSVKAKTLDLILELDDNLPNTHADLSRLSQVVSNLLGNAIKFVPKGGRIRIRSGSADRSNIQGVELSVEDSGPGVDPKDRERLMKPFVKGKSPGSDGEIGSGLGLSICKEILSLHEGTLEIGDSELGGAIFKAWIPSCTHVCEKEAGQSRVAANGTNV